MTSIMLLSEDRELAKVLKKALREANVRISAEFGNAKAAADAYAQQRVPLVVVDLFLSGSSGLDAIKLLKRVDENCTCLLLARTHTRTLVERAFRMGAHDVLPYPASTDIIRGTILHRLENQPEADAEESGEARAKK